MSAYTVTAVQPNPRQWNSQQGGPMLGYRMTVKDGQGNEIQNVEWSRKQTSPAPTVGQQLDGTIDMQAQYGPKFKQAPTAGGGGGGGRPRDPAERRSIEMQHAQKCAVEALKLAAAHGDYKPPNAADVVQHIKTLADALYRQCEEASA